MPPWAVSLGRSPRFSAKGEEWAFEEKRWILALGKEEIQIFSRPFGKKTTFFEKALDILRSLC